MADLLTSLIEPDSPRSSQDSFHSFSSQPKAHKAALSTPLPPTNAFQAAGLPVYDIDSYLTENADLSSNATKSKKATKKSSQTAINPIEPIPLGTRTSYHVAALNSQCQSKGFLPVFEIEGDASYADFGGILKLQDATVTSDQRWRSKKEAREGLAEKGLEIVKGMEAKGKDPKTPHEVGKNWIGLLHEYHALIDPNLGPIYEDFKLGSAYTCTCTIPALPDRSFGSNTNAFPSKKVARANAAKEAVEYLIERGDLNSDGSTKARKKVKLTTAVRIQGQGLEVKKNSTYAQKVNDMCPLLGLAPPQYVLRPASAGAPNMLSGYASFPDTLDMPAEIGEVRHVFGKKKAKEEVAKAVWEVLAALAAKRNVSIDLMDREDTSGEDLL